MSFFNCPRCKTQNAQGSLFCSNCGLAFNNQQPQQNAAKKKTFSIPLIVLIVLLGTCGFCGIFGVIVGLIQDKNANVAVSNSQNQTTNANSVNVSLSKHSNLFNETEVCNYPKSSPIAKFKELGGGTWGKWNDSDTSGYSCEKSKDSIIVFKNDASMQKVSVDYVPIGNKDGVGFIGLDYYVSQLLSPLASENKERKDFIDFCDYLSKKALNTGLSISVKQKMLDTKWFSPSGEISAGFAERIGLGYVQITGNKNDKLLLIGFKIFPSEEAYKKYKDQ